MPLGDIPRIRRLYEDGLATQQIAQPSLAGGSVFPVVSCRAQDSDADFATMTRETINWAVRTVYAITTARSALAFDHKQPSILMFDSSDLGRPLSFFSYRRSPSSSVCIDLV